MDQNDREFKKKKKKGKWEEKKSGNKKKEIMRFSTNEIMSVQNKETNLLYPTNPYPFFFFK